MPLRRYLAVAFTLIALATLAPSAARACSCTNLPEFPRAFDESGAVFRGTVVEVVIVATQPFATLTAKVAVNAWWKGAPHDTMLIETAADEGLCGFPFAVGTEYLIYAFNSPLFGGPAPDGVVSTHLCWRSHPTYPNDPDIAALDAIPARAPSWGTLKLLYR